MGVLAASAQMNQLIAYEHDINYKILVINQAKIALTGAQEDLLNAGTDLDPESPVAKQIEQRKARLEAIDKKLDMQLEEYKTRLELIEKSKQACEAQMK